MSKWCWFFAHRNWVEQSTSKQRHFCLSKLRQTKYVKMTPIFHPLKLRQIKHVKTRMSESSLTFLVKTTSIFRLSKLHRNSTWNWCGHLSIFSFGHIDAISTLNVVRALGHNFNNTQMMPTGCPYYTDCIDVQTICFLFMDIQRHQMIESVISSFWTQVHFNVFERMYTVTFLNASTL